MGARVARANEIMFRIADRALPVGIARVEDPLEFQQVDGISRLAFV